MILVVVFFCFKCSTVSFQIIVNDELSLVFIFDRLRIVKKYVAYSKTVMIVHHVAFILHT